MTHSPLYTVLDGVDRSPDKGILARGVNAAHDIPKGTRIMDDKPVMYILIP